MDKKAKGLQRRAENAASKFDAAARKPIIIEFSGTPKAGKTSTISAIQSFFKRCGFDVEVVVERASVCPIRDKRHFNFNVWTASTTLAQILEKTQTPARDEDPQILILDRGLFDAICWLNMMESLKRVRSADKEIIERFLLIDDWKNRIGAVYFMTADPEDAMNRERGLIPLTNATGSIMNEQVLRKITSSAKRVARKYGKEFGLVEINTSQRQFRNNQKAVAEKIASHVLGLIEEQLDENVLSLPKPKLNNVFGANEVIDAKNTKTLIAEFVKNGRYHPREKVERDSSRVQALPIVVIKNKSGEILQLKRKEQDPKKPLHEAFVIWAGGHVRKEDRRKGSPIEQCLIREIKEELRLDLEPSNFHLLGAMYTHASTGLSKHVAIVYEWNAETDDIKVVLNNTEFFERRGTSQSGRFVKMAELIDKVKENKSEEIWSDYIVRYFLAPKSMPERLL